VRISGLKVKNSKAEAISDRVYYSAIYPSAIQNIDDFARRALSDEAISGAERPLRRKSMLLAASYFE